MTKDELLRRFAELTRPDRDLEEDHVKADRLLLAYINDEEITAAFDAIEKWYA